MTGQVVACDIGIYRQLLRRIGSVSAIFRQLARPSPVPVLIRLFLPILPKEHERDVVRHQQSRNPECRNRISCAHVGLGPVACGQSYSAEKVYPSRPIPTSSPPCRSSMPRVDPGCAPSAYGVIDKSPRFEPANDSLKVIAVEQPPCSRLARPQLRRSKF